MGTGAFSTAFLCIMIALLFIGLVGTLVCLIYKHIDEKEFDPKLFWIAIGFAILAGLSIIATVDFSKYESKLKTEIVDSKYKSLIETPLPDGYEEIRTYDIFINDENQWKNATKFISHSDGIIEFTTAEGEHIYTNSIALVTEHIEVIHK